MLQQNRMERVKEQIQRQEIRAREAKEKGMNTAYRNCISEIAVLKSKLQKLRTDPNRKYI